MSGSNAKKRSCHANYVTNWGVKQKENHPSRFHWNVSMPTASVVYCDWYGVKKRFLSDWHSVGWCVDQYKWINEIIWTESDERKLTEMKSRNKRHWRSVLEDDDEFLSQMMETIQDDYVRNKIMNYCTFNHVEKVFKQVLKELTENFPTLIQVCKNSLSVYKYKSPYQYWRK